MYLGSKTQNQHFPLMERGLKWQFEHFKIPVLGISIGKSDLKLFKFNVLPKLKKIENIVAIQNTGI